MFRLIYALALTMVLAAPALAQPNGQTYLLLGPPATPPTIASPGNPFPVTGTVTGTVTTKPGPYTIVPLDVATVTTGSTAVTALTAGHATAGGFIMTANAAGICVDQHTTAGTATGTPSTTTCVPQNLVFSLVPSVSAVSVNSTASSVALGGEGLQ